MKQLSLRLRLLIAVAAIVLVALGAADVVVYSVQRNYLFNQIDTTLNSSHRAVEQTADNPASVAGGSVFVPHGGSPNGIPGAGGHSGIPSGDQGETAFCALGRESAPGMFIEVRTTSGAIVTGTAGKEYCPAFQPGSAAYAPKLPTTISGLAASSENQEELVTFFTASSTAAGGPSFRVRASSLTNGNILIVATPMADLDSTLSQLLVVELLVSSGALIGALLLGLWLVRVGLRPLRDVERTADAISEGDLMHRVPNANRRTEVGHLSTAFNVMLERIEGLVNDLRASEGRLRRFVGDASHELRTPIAAVSAYTQLFRQGAASRKEDLDRAMTGIERETGRMSRLVEDLLTLAKLDEHSPLESEPVELVGLAIEAAETARTVGGNWPITFEAIDGPVEVFGDHGALRQVIDNLLSNVRAHTPEGTNTTLTISRTDGAAIIEVADDGPGITEKQTQVIFDRFFRVDPSRTRATGGSGLGLAIVASIVDAHGGRISAGARPGGGARFEVRLPLLQSSDAEAEIDPAAT